MNITIRTITGATFEVEFIPGETVLSLKQRIFEHFNKDEVYAVNKQHLIVAGRDLVNSTVLDENYLNLVNPFPYSGQTAIYFIKRTMPLTQNEQLYHLTFQEFQQEQPDIASQMMEINKDIAVKWDAEHGTGQRKKLVDSISFDAFHTQFLALFDDTNSTGIKQILKKMKEVSTLEDESEKFKQVGQVMKAVAEKRIDRFLSKKSFFGPGRSQLAETFYNLAAPKNRKPSEGLLNSSRSLNKLLETMKISTNQPGTHWKAPDLFFAEFTHEFIKKYGNTNSTGIKKVMKHMKALLKFSGDPIKDNDIYKYTKICKIMMDITKERRNKNPVGRSDETKEFYDKVANCSYKVDDPIKASDVKTTALYHRDDMATFIGKLIPTPAPSQAIKTKPSGQSPKP